MKYPSEIETPLDRRAMTIDILAGELERKNRNTAAWRKRVEELHARINELEEEVLTVEEELKLSKGTMKKKRASNNGKANGTLEDKYK